MRFGCHPYSVSHYRYPAPTSDLSSVWVIWQVIGYQSQVTDNRREVQLKGAKIRMKIRRSTHNSKLDKTPTLVLPQPGPHFDSHLDPHPDLHLILILILFLSLNSRPSPILTVFIRAQFDSHPSPHLDPDLSSLGPHLDNLIGHTIHPDT